MTSSTRDDQPGPLPFADISAAGRPNGSVVQPPTVEGLNQLAGTMATRTMRVSTDSFKSVATSEFPTGPETGPDSPRRHLSPHASKTKPRHSPLAPSPLQREPIQKGKPPGEGRGAARRPSKEAEGWGVARRPSSEEEGAPPKPVRVTTQRGELLISSLPTVFKVLSALQLQREQLLMLIDYAPSTFPFGNFLVRIKVGASESVSGYAGTQILSLNEGSEPAVHLRGSSFSVPLRYISNEAFSSEELVTIARKLIEPPLRNLTVEMANRMLQQKRDFMDAIEATIEARHAAELRGELGDRVGDEDGGEVLDGHGDGGGAPEQQPRSQTQRLQRGSRLTEESEGAGSDMRQIL